MTVDTYRIANGNLELPLVPQYLCNMLRDFTLSDLRDFLTIFDKGHSLTPAAFHRILESYGLAVKNPAAREDPVGRTCHEAGRDHHPHLGGWT